MSEPIPAAELAARFVTLCTRGGAGRDWPRKQRDRWILLRVIQARLVSEAPLGEREVTARLQDWLLGPGRDFAIDAVSLRRALVDEGFLDRDDYGREYRVSSRHERRVRFEDLPPDLDARVASRRAT